MAVSPSQEGSAGMEGFLCQSRVKHDTKLDLKKSLGGG